MDIKYIEIPESTSDMTKVPVFTLNIRILYLLQYLA